jgi:hypothetical protein
VAGYGRRPEWRGIVKWRDTVGGRSGVTEALARDLLAGAEKSGEESSGRPVTRDGHPRAWTRGTVLRSARLGGRPSRSVARSP